ncbi:zinc metallopeptidase, partial [Bacillus cereus]
YASFRFRNFQVFTPSGEQTKLRVFRIYRETLSRFSCAASSNISWIFIMLGASMANLLLLGIILMAAGVVFQLVTLPVEFDASKRAMQQIEALGIVSTDEYGQARKVLNAAALTYVAAAAVAVFELLRLVLMYTGMQRSDD